MGLDFEALDEIWAVVRTNPLRTGLTALGVFWGMFMLLAMVGFGEGLANGTQGAIGDSVTNAVSIWGRRTRLPYRGQQAGRPVRFAMEDAYALSALPGVAEACPRTQLGGWRDGTPVTYGDHAAAAQVMGDVPTVLPTLGIVMQSGRFLNARDRTERRKVVVLGANLVEALYAEGEDPVGTTVAIKGVVFTVVGWFQAREADDRGDRANGTVHIPVETFQQVFNTQHIGWLSFVVEDEMSAESVEDTVRADLAARHQVHPDDRQAMGSWNAEADFQRLQNLFAAIRLVIWLVGAATLASGVVGVSNIMLIVVRERTQEIGLRRAIGATPRQIATMILGEAALLTGVAGTAGLVAGIVLVEGVAATLGPDSSLGVPRIDPGTALGAFAVLMVAGAFAGWLPAQRALAIEPVLALRSE